MQKFRHLKCTTSVCVLNELAGPKSSPHQEIFAMQNMRLLFCLVFVFPTSLCGVLVFNSVSRRLLRRRRAWARLVARGAAFCNPQLCHTPSLTRNFVTHNFDTHTHNFVTHTHTHTLSPRHFAWQEWHLVISTFTLQKDATLSHTTLHTTCFISRSSTTSFVFPSFPVPAFDICCSLLEEVDLWG